MDQANTSTFTSVIPNEQSSDIIYGEGYVYTGPLAAQHYEIPSKYITEIKQDDMNSTKLLTNKNEYHFKVMLLGDSGVGKFLFRLSSTSMNQIR
jgi:hypothetical protein